MNKTSRNFDSQYRKKLVIRIKKLKNKEDYIDIYNIIISDIGTNFSSNINGLFININLFTDDCIKKLNLYLDSRLSDKLCDKTDKTINSYKTFITEDSSDTVGYKLSTQEKTS